MSCPDPLYDYDDFDDVRKDSDDGYDASKDNWEVGDEPMNSRQRRENESLNETYRQNGWWNIMSVFTFHRIDTHEYVGMFFGSDWMEARSKASIKSGIPIDDILPWAFNTESFPLPEVDETPHYPYDWTLRKCKETFLWTLKKGLV